jgi:enoyl-CoA hydratase/carnithine racemase
MNESVLFESRDGVAIITLNRPEARNAMNREMAEAMASALDEFEDEPGFRVAVLTAVGPVFCAGMDLKAFAASGERPVTAGRGAFGLVERPPAKPLIAAVETLAIGGGFEIALACDLIVASKQASFGLPEVKRGLVAAGGGVVRLPRRIPRNVAMEMVLSGQPVGAERAFELGLVNRIVEVGQSLEEACRWAAEIVRNAPLAMQASKVLVDMAMGWPSDQLFSYQAPYVDAVRASVDAAEGARAFVEKRPPVWVGM